MAVARPRCGRGRAPRRARGGGFTARRRPPIIGLVDEDGNELAWVRLELDILASAHRDGTLTDVERARFGDLLRRECALLGLDDTTGT
jgi:hypothetical protein